MTDIQRVELRAFYHVSIFCPFCGKKVVDNQAAAEGDEEGAVNSCRHTLFVAHDEGFEYRSPRFDDDLGIAGLEAFEEGFPEGDLDTVTDRVSITDAVKFAAYSGPPGEMGSYVGFAPVEGD